MVISISKDGYVRSVEPWTNNLKYIRLSVRPPKLKNGKDIAPRKNASSWGSQVKKKQPPASQSDKNGQTRAFLQYLTRQAAEVMEQAIQTRPSSEKSRGNEARELCYNVERSGKTLHLHTNLHDFYHIKIIIITKIISLLTSLYITLILTLTPWICSES